MDEDPSKVPAAAAVAEGAPSRSGAAALGWEAPGQCLLLGGCGRGDVEMIMETAVASWDRLSSGLKSPGSLGKQEGGGKYATAGSERGFAEAVNPGDPEVGS